MRTITLAFPLLTAVAALPAQSGWSAPVLQSTLNTTATDSGPHLSADGLTLHWSSNILGGANYEIYTSTRPGPGSPWSAPAQVVEVSDPGTDDQPFMTADGLELWFGSLRAGGAGGFDLWRATRLAVGLPWSAPAPVTEVNSSGSESAPSLTADGLELYFLTTGWGNPTAPNNNIFRATRLAPGLPFDPPTLVAELLGTSSHRDAEISPDGLTIHYTEPVAGRLQVMGAERLASTLPFGTPVMLNEFATTGNGVFGFTRSLVGNEAMLAVSFAVASGSQQLMDSRFDGLTHEGIATPFSTMNLHYRDSAFPGRVYMLGVALGNTGFPFGTRHVPLDPDFILQLTLGFDLPPITTGFLGVLDANGEAPPATLFNLGGILTGLPVWAGAFTLDPPSPLGVATISNAVPALFQ